MSNKGRVKMTIRCNSFAFAHHLGLALALLLLCMAKQGHAHGVRGAIASQQATCVEVSYDDGEPLSYARVEVSAPDSGQPFQSGLADRNGLFCFRPDIPGDWRLVISDGMGHQLRLKNRVATNMTRSEQDLPVAPGRKIGFSKVEGVVTGMAVIFGCAGIMAWMRCRRKIAQNTHR